MTKAELQNKIDELEARIRELEGSGTLHVSVVQDKSGSMYSQIDAVIDGFNEYIDSLRRDQLDGEVRFTLTQFDSTTEILYEDAPLDVIKRFTAKDYRPSGATALLDAVGVTIESLKRSMKKADRALVIVMTDGQENSSRTYTYAQIVDSIKECESKNFTFVYLGEDQDAWTAGQAGASFGVTSTNTLGFDKTYRGRTSTMQNLAVATRSYGASGQSSSASFVEDFMPKSDDDEDSK